VRNLADMVTSFLNFARPQPLQLDEVDLDELIQECASELESFYKTLDVELSISRPVRSVDSSSERIVIRADERMLRQTLLNLMRNAAEAIPAGQSNRRVEVSSTSSEKGWAVVEIKDTGEGIPAADLQRIFIPFFTTKATGHGVGLALAHRVITQHGGTLTARNAKDGGAVFTIRLPVS
jgi:signal transduction histidine kinase